MAAKKFNTYWKRRKKNRGHIFQTAQKFEKWWWDYFKFCDENPWYKNEAVKSGKEAGTIIQIPAARPYTEAGFIAFHGLGQTYLRQLESTLKEREDEASKDISTVLSWAKNVCYTQKFEGAVVGVFNANIIARDLGLAEKTDHTTNGKDILQSVSDEELNSRIETLLGNSK